MGDKSAIQWTDATWNPVTGCSKVSPGCKFCYAERVAKRLWPSQYPPVTETVFRGDCPGPVSELLSRPRRFTDVQCHEDRLDQPLRWKKPRKVFVNSMSDLFHEDVPDAFIDRVFAVMALAPQHTFQVLTKRAERMRHYFEMHWHQRVAALLRAQQDRISKDQEQQRAQGYNFASLTCGLHNERALPNVWLGVSVENQHFADARIPLLLQTPAAVRFISAEPLLGPVSLHPPADNAFKLLSRFYSKDGFDPTGGQPVADRNTALFPKLDWVIVGGESGSGARSFDVAWARAIVAQCQAAGVPVFVKQLGANAVAEYGGLAEHPPGAMYQWLTRDSHGGDMTEWPADLRVREFPKVEACV